MRRNQHPPTLLEGMYNGVECRTVQPLWKAVWLFLKDLNREVPCDPTRGTLKDRYLMQVCEHE